jgi:hypothetical protein
MAVKGLDKAIEIAFRYFNKDIVKNDNTYKDKFINYTFNVVYRELGKYVIYNNHKEIYATIAIAVDNDIKRDKRIRIISEL